MAKSQSIEFQFLLSVLKVGLQSSSACPLSSHSRPNHDLNWTHVYRLAHHHQILSLIHQGIVSIPNLDLPDEIKTPMRQQIHREARHRLWLSAELVRICSTLHDQQIPVLPLKGPLLSMQLYGDLTLRHQGDLDLLIQPEDYPRVKQTLIDLGYQHAQATAAQWTTTQEHTFLSLHGQINFWRFQPGAVVDVHTRWFRNTHAFPLEFSAAWSQRQPLSLQGHPFTVLDPVHTLLFLCVHGAKHHWEKLFWLVDVIQWIRTYPDSEWEQILQEARRLGCQRSLAQALVLLERYLGSPIPAVAQTIFGTDPVVIWLANQSRIEVEPPSESRPQVVEPESLTPTGPLELWSELHYMTRLQQNMAYKWACLAHLRTSTRDWELLPLPPQLSLLYYPLRPILYLLRAGQAWRTGQRRSPLP